MPFPVYILSQKCFRHLLGKYTKGLIIGDISPPRTVSSALRNPKFESEAQLFAASFINLLGSLSSLGYPGAYTSSKIISNHDKEAHHGSDSVFYSLV
jgi:hypothetical protein